MMTSPSKTAGELVRRIWGLCNILRGDGVSYHEYITELTYLLFLKIAEETGSEADLPDGFRWRDLVSYDGGDLLTFYRDMLTFLGGHATSPIIKDIYAFPTTVFSHQENLRAVVEGLDKLDWHLIEADALGDMYEGLLSKNSQDARSGAGQYFTPRALVDCMIELMQPSAGEVIQDPACGTGGFLVAAKQFAEKRGDDAHNPCRFEGVEIEKATYRICQMNSYLHGLNANLILGDALTSDAGALAPADLILANPPFGNKAGSARATRSELPHRTANKQLAFLQHIRLAMKQGGRAAVIVPDNVLFEAGTGRAIRRDLMEDCDLHTILRLPNGIFYSQGVNTNVLFFTRRSGHPGNSERVRIYDMRTSMPRFGRTRQLAAEHFADFVAGYHDEFSRSSQGSSGERWRTFRRSEIAKNEDNLDLVWMSDRPSSEFKEVSTQEFLASILFNLQNAMAEIELLADDLAQDELD